jgi:hypothetical protein
MSSNEFEVVTALEKVRAMKSLIEQLDPMVPALIPDAEHASIRRTLRKWEADLQAKVSIRNRAPQQTTSGSPLDVSILDLREPTLREVK